MFILHDWYPGDRVVEFFLIVSIGVVCLSTVAWGVARRLRRVPAARHLVLLSALFGCLAMPIMAMVFSASGLTVISIPLLPTQPNGIESSNPASDPIAIRRPTYAAGTPPPTLTVGSLAGVDLPRSAEASPCPNDSRQPDVAVTFREQPVSAQSGTQMRIDIHRAEWSLRYHAYATLVLIAWGLGSVVLLLRLGRSWLIVDRIRRKSVAVGDATLLHHVENLGRSLAFRRLPRLATSRRVRTPLAFGFGRPVIIFPDCLIGAVDEHEMRDVLLHEMAHLSRHDPLIVLVQELARALYWPIAPIHGLIGELGRAREELCDNYVLAGAHDGLSYGETLLHLAEFSQSARPLVAAVGIIYWNGELERRIAGLLDQGRSTMTKNNRWLVCVVALLFIAGGTIASATRLSAGSQQKKGNAPKAHEPERTKAPEKPRRTMQVHAVGPDGRPMAGVAIHRGVWTRKPIKDRRRDFMSDGRGPVVIDLPEGMYIFRLWARKPGHVPLFAHWEEEDNPETSLPAEFTFRLRPGTAIGGVVRDSEGQPIKGVVVEVMLESGGRGRRRHLPRHVAGRARSDNSQRDLADHR